MSDLNKYKKLKKASSEVVRTSVALEPRQVEFAKARGLSLSAIVRDLLNKFIDENITKETK